MINLIADIHYNRKKAPVLLNIGLCTAEFFYKTIIKCKNFLYEKNILKEKKVNAYVICVGNLTTGGVGKTPFVEEIAKSLQGKKPAIISRGYKARIDTKNPVVVRDWDKIYFKDGTLCADEPYQLAKKVSCPVIICKDRVKGANFAIEKFNVDTIILDDGFSNRTIKKDKTYVLVDSLMRFGNNHLLPKGPLREPVCELKRADELVLINKNDENFPCAIDWLKQFNKTADKVLLVEPKRIYNLKTKAEVVNPKKAIAFCAIGQPQQFFSFAKKFYNLIETVSYKDHYSYTKKDIKNLITLAKAHKVNSFITTQKDEGKLYQLVDSYPDYSFNVLELKTTIKRMN